MPEKEYIHKFDPIGRLSPEEDYRLLVDVTRSVLKTWGTVEIFEVKDESLNISICAFKVIPSKGASFPVNVLREGKSSCKLVAPYYEIYKDVDREVDAIAYENNTIFSPYSSLADPD